MPQRGYKNPFLNLQLYDNARTYTRGQVVIHRVSNINYIWVLGVASSTGVAPSNASGNPWGRGGIAPATVVGAQGLPGIKGPEPSDAELNALIAELVLEPSDSRLKGLISPLLLAEIQAQSLQNATQVHALIAADLLAGNYITQATAQRLINNTLQAVTDASIFAEALFSVDRDAWHEQLASYRYVWLRKIEEDRNTDNPEVVIDLGIVALGDGFGLTFTHGLKKTGTTVEIDESVFDDTVSTAFYTNAGNVLPADSSLFALSNADGSTFFDIQDSNLDWQALTAPGRVYISNTQGDHIDPFGTAGTKTTADYEADDKLIIQAANPLTTPTLTLTLSSGPTDYGSGDTAGKYYSYSAIAVDVDFALDPSDSYRVSLDAHPVIQIPAGNIKGNKWVELSAGNLEEFAGAPTHILSVNATGVKGQPYDDLQKNIVNVDTTVRFPSVERQADNAATPNANYFSIHTPVDDVYPVRWTAKNARQKTFLVKFLKAEQVLQFDMNASGRMRLLADATVSGDTFAFDATITGAVPPPGQIYDMYSLGRALGEIYVERDELKPRETDFWGDFVDTSLDPSVTDKRWTVGFTSEASGVPTLANQYDTLTAVEAGTRTLVISPTQFDTSDLNNPNITPGTVTLTADDLTDPMYFHYSLDTSGKNYVKLTPTGTPATLGTGNAQLLYVVGTVAVHGTIARKYDGGTLDDTVAVRDREPSSFFDGIEIPWKAIVNFNILNYVATAGAAIRDWIQNNLTHAFKSAIQGSNEDEDLTGTFERVALGIASIGDNRYEYSTGPERMQISVADDLENVGSNDYKLNKAIKERAWVKIGGHWTGEILSLTSRYLSNQRPQYNIDVKTISGTVPAVGQSDTLEIVGEDVHRGQLGWWTFIKNLWTSVTQLASLAIDDVVLVADRSDSSKVKAVQLNTLAPFLRNIAHGDAAENSFDSSTYTSYNKIFNSNDILLIVYGTDTVIMNTPAFVRFGDVSTSYHTLDVSTFRMKRSGNNLQFARQSGSDTLYVRVVILSSNSS